MIVTFGLKTSLIAHIRDKIIKLPNIAPQGKRSSTDLFTFSNTVPGKVLKISISNGSSTFSKEIAMKTLQTCYILMTRKGLKVQQRVQGQEPIKVFRELSELSVS